MGRERDRASELLLDLGAVTVSEHAVRRQIAVAFREMRPLGGSLARTRNARLRVDDDVGSLEQQSGVGERCQREQRGRGIAAGIRHEPGRANGSPLALRESVCDVRRASCACPGTTVRAVPASRSRNAPDRSITRTPRSTRSGASSAAAASGSARNTRSASRTRAATSSGAIVPVPEARQSRQRTRRRRGARRSGGRQRHSRVAREQPEQFLPRVAGRAGDCDPGGTAATGLPLDCLGGRSKAMHGKGYLYTAPEQEINDRPVTHC